MIKHFIGVAIVFVSLTACDKKAGSKLPADIVTISATADSSNNSSSAEKPEITFEENAHNFGVITEGEQVEYNFKFKNTGKADLLIVNASASCGCTVPEYPKGLIKPGEAGVMKVKFDSKGKSGTFDKTVNVTCNTEPRETTLTISGEVMPKK